MNVLNKIAFMKKFSLLLILVMTVFVVYAQNEKNLVYDANAQVRAVKDFNAIEVSGAIDLFLSQGNEEAVAVSAGSGEAADRIKTDVRNGVLHVYFEGRGWNWKLWNNNKMKAYITFKELHRVEASGACNLKTTETIKSTDLKIQLSGASDFSANLMVGDLKIGASGASNLKISGTADKTDIDVSGACDVKGYNLKTDYCKVDASGASTIRITVNKELNASASGGSSIYYKGTGVTRNISTSGIASVKRKTED